MSTYSRSSFGSTSDGPLTAIGGIVLLVNVAGLFAFTGLALVIFGYIGITIWLIWMAGRTSAKTKAFRSAEAAMVCSWFVALVTGVLVGALHWVKFPYAAYATLGLYSLAAAIWICGRALNFLSACWFTSFGTALWAAVICLPAPPGSEDPSDRENRTKVVARFIDDAGLPIEDVDVWFDLKWYWRDDPALRDKPDASSLRPDNPYGLPPGSAPWDAADDPRYRVLVIRARRGPARDGQDAGYEDVRHEMLLPVRGQEYHVQLALKERPHPDVAFLDVTGEPPASETPFFEVLLGRERELPRSSQGIDSDAWNANWARAHISSRDGLRGSLRVGPDLAGRPLFLHVDVMCDGWKLARPIEPLHLGERRSITLPLR